MSFEVTATRRRPQQFETLAGQEFVVSTLKNAIESGRIAHAYLFCGPRGVGKTTSARLLAKALNCKNGPTAEPCGQCENCRGIAKGNNIDVIEIDGASNTGVNDVRVIKEEVLFPPTSSRYKIYIIDEVHMLSQSAFNALLKTIEEPPEYVVFIFATTEAQKVPATIRSRCQQFNFQLIPLETIKRLLAEAAKEMGIEAEDEALFWIAKEATGSMRDAYTLFDQVVAFSNEKITLDKIREKLGLVGVEKMNGLMLDILAKKTSSAIEKIHDLLSRGVSVEQIIKDFTDYFRNLLLIKDGVKSENVLGEQIASFPEEVLKAYNSEQLETALDMFLGLYRDIRYSLNPSFELELAVSKLTKLRYVASNAVIVEQIARLKNDLINGEITPVNPHLKEESSIEPQQPSGNLDSVLPNGVDNVIETQDGLILEFGGKFYYESALRSFSEIKKRIQNVIGTDKNVQLSFSEQLNQEKQKELQVSVPPAPEPEKKPEPVKEMPQNTDFANDLILGFKGHEIHV